jgi:hypothetical protein
MRRCVETGDVLFRCVTLLKKRRNPASPRPNAQNHRAQIWAGTTAELQAREAARSARFALQAAEHANTSDARVWSARAGIRIRFPLPGICFWIIAKVRFELAGSAARIPPRLSRLRRPRLEGGSRPERQVDIYLAGTQCRPPGRGSARMAPTCETIRQPARRQRGGLWLRVFARDHQFRIICADSPKTMSCRTGRRCCCKSRGSCQPSKANSCLAGLKAPNGSDLVGYHSKDTGFGTARQSKNAGFHPKGA